AFVDKEGNIIEGFTCLPGYFCSGSCNNRYCDNKEYNWINQLICYNPKLISSTIKTTIATKTSSSSTEAITNSKPAKSLKMNIRFEFLFFSYTLVSLSYISNDQSVEENFVPGKNNNLAYKYCNSYLTKYGFLVNRKACGLDYCCGGCFDRYCCSKSTEEIKNQYNCLNDYDFSVPEIRKLNCEAFVDKEGNIINGFNCLPGYFCSGSCHNRYCDNREYKWLNQLICYNPKSISSTIKTTVTTITSSLLTKEVKKVKLTHGIIYLIIAVISCIIVTVMLALAIYKRFFAKRSNGRNVFLAD
ncbi:unnamed protein product, partial [Brachionus calyciflorus]